MMEGFFQLVNATISFHDDTQMLFLVLNFVKFLVDNTRSITTE